jgi:hypothetical protein
VMPVVKSTRLGNYWRRPAMRSSPRRKWEMVSGSTTLASQWPTARGGLLLVEGPQCTRASTRRCLGQQHSMTCWRSGGNRSRAKSGAWSKEREREETKGVFPSSMVHDRDKGEQWRRTWAMVKQGHRWETGRRVDSGLGARYRLPTSMCWH